MSARIRGIAGFERTVADLARTEAFYRDGLGFARVGVIEALPAAIGDAYGSGSAAAVRLTMRLGAQVVAFLAFDPPGAPYPGAPLATDPVFQHLAIPVRSMEAGHAQVARLSPQAISLGGPQRCPRARAASPPTSSATPTGIPSS